MSAGLNLQIQTHFAHSTISKINELRLLGVNNFESLTPICLSFSCCDALIQIPATTIGPIKEPRPASSTPPIRRSLDKWSEDR